METADNGKLIERHGIVIADRLAKAQRSTNKRKFIDDEQKLAKERDEAREKVCLGLNFNQWP